MKNLIKSIAIVLVIIFMGSCEVKESATVGQILVFSIVTFVFITFVAIAITKMGKKADEKFEELVDKYNTDTEL